MVGAGASGRSAARLAARYGARVVLNDGNDSLPPEDGIKCVFGGHPQELFLDSDLIVVSPGVPSIPPLVAAESAGIPVISEVELALWGLRAPIAAVTGTNGKSTTVSLIGELLKTIDERVFVGGNLGTPVTSIVDTPAARLPVVLELSSFQLERTPSLRAKVALLLNVTEDHLDRYESFEEYASVKSRIFRNQKPHDHAIVNMDDPQALKQAAAAKSQVWYFSGAGNPDAHFRIDGDSLVFMPFSMEIPVSSVPLPGRHNLENVMAAVGAALFMGVDRKAVVPVIESFRGLSHRMEFVGEIRGVSYYNDSKATNVGSVVGSLRGFPGNIVLIAGGRHKGAPYTPLREVLQMRTRALVLIGESAPLIERDLEGIAPVFRAMSMHEAVSIASKVALPGDSVVLSPACSSYDMFRNYRERGDSFRNAVRYIASTMETDGEKSSR